MHLEVKGNAVRGNTERSKVILRTYIYICFCCFTLFFVKLVLAEAELAPLELNDPLSAERIIRTLVSLVAVCALIALVVGKLLPKLQGVNWGRKSLLSPVGTSTAASGRNELKLLQRTSLDADNALFLIEDPGGQCLLVSSGASGVVIQGELDANGCVRPFGFGGEQSGKEGGGEEVIKALKVLES